MKQNIALIQPNSPFLINERVVPNIGLVRVATQLRDEGHNVDLLDYSGVPKRDIREDVQRRADGYDLFGISSTTPQFSYATNIHNYIKDANSSAKVVIGGAHPSSLYQAKQRGVDDINIKDLEVFDTIFCGEGEETSGIFKDGWQQGKPIKNIDDCPIPDRDFLEMDSYNYDLLGERTTPIQTQRGCPYSCTFCCGRDIDMYNKVRVHSPERVLEELDGLNDDYGFTSFQIYDDEVNINIGRLEELCSILKHRDYQFRGFIRNDQIVKHPETVRQMKDAGFVKLCAGVESGSDRILKIINKKLDYKTSLEARQIVKKEGIHYEAFMLMGHPDETLDDIELTKQWLLEAQPDDFDLNLLTPYPGSKIYDESVPSTQFVNYSQEWKGLYFNKERFSQTDTYYKGLNRQSKSNIRTQAISNEEFINIRNDLEEEIRTKI